MIYFSSSFLQIARGFEIEIVSPLELSGIDCAHGASGFSKVLQTRKHVQVGHALSNTKIAIWVYPTKSLLKITFQSPILHT